MQVLRVHYVYLMATTGSNMCLEREGSWRGIQMVRSYMADLQKGDINVTFQCSFQSVFSKVIKVRLHEYGVYRQCLPQWTKITEMPKG